MLVEAKAIFYLIISCNNWTFECRSCQSIMLALITMMGKHHGELKLFLLDITMGKNMKNYQDLRKMKVKDGKVQVFKMMKKV